MRYGWLWDWVFMKWVNCISISKKQLIIQYCDSFSNCWRAVFREMKTFFTCILLCTLSGKQQPLRVHINVMEKDRQFPDILEHTIDEMNTLLPLRWYRVSQRICDITGRVPCAHNADLLCIQDMKWIPHHTKHDGTLQNMFSFPWNNYISIIFSPFAPNTLFQM